MSTFSAHPEFLSFAPAAHFVPARRCSRARMVTYYYTLTFCAPSFVKSSLALLQNINTLNNHYLLNNECINNTKPRKRGGVAYKKGLKASFLSLFNHCFSYWDILYLAKLGNSVKTLGQITPLLSFFSPDEWHGCCIKDNNDRKGNLCRYNKHKPHLLKRISLRTSFRLHMNCQMGLLR